MANLGVDGDAPTRLPGSPRASIPVNRRRAVAIARSLRNLYADTRDLHAALMGMRAVAEWANTLLDMLDTT